MIEKKKIIGREKEIKELNELYNSDSNELVAIYGRRRVGKTYLVINTFKNNITFLHSGVEPIKKKKNSKLATTIEAQNQLKAFSQSLITKGINVPVNGFNDYYEPFRLLAEYLDEINNGDRQLIFFDEVPWMDVEGANFMQAFSWFYNSWAIKRNNIMIIVTGSAISWIINNFIKNTRGLYGRLTKQFNIMPFTLKETEQFLENKGIKYSRYDIARIYMMLGGIPYYLNFLKPKMSVGKNLDNIFYTSKDLDGEFSVLFNSVMDHASLAMKIVKVLSNSKIGYQRKDLAKAVGTNDNQIFSKTLEGLIDGGFIIKYVPFKEDKRKVIYKLIDSFSLFYLKYIDNKNSLDQSFFEPVANQNLINTLFGLSFENIAFYHINQIKKTLGISGVKTEQYPCYLEKENSKTQIDLLIQRSDNIINICEIKFYYDEYVVTKSEHEKMIKRYNLLKEKINKNVTIQNILITTVGLKENIYSSDYVSTLTLDDLFQ